MIFSKKKTVIAYTVEKCKKCGMQRKRKFTGGDILFTESLNCTSCNGITIIEKIYGETIQE